MRDIKCTDDISLWHIKIINNVDALYKELDMEQNSPKESIIKKEIESELEVLFLRVSPRQEIALKKELKTNERLRYFRKKISAYVPTESKLLGHWTPVDMESYEESEDIDGSEDLNRSYEEKKRVISLHCPKCGYKFMHEVLINGQVTGGIGGVATGAILGGKIGLALGPLGAIAGTIPGAILGGIFGKNLGNDYDSPRCPNCATKFQIPNSLK